MRKTMLLAMGLLAIGALVVFGSCSGDSSNSTSSTTGSNSSGSAEASRDEKQDVVLARVGDYEITAEAVADHMQKSTGAERVEADMQSPDKLQMATTGLMDQFVWAKKAESEGYKLTKSEQEKIDALRSELLATRYVGDVVQYKADPTKEQVEDYYKSNQTRFFVPAKVGAFHCLVKTEAEADMVLKKARNGADFKSLVQQYSIDEGSKDISGALGYIQEGKIPNGFPRRDMNFESKVLPLEEGDLVKVHTVLGWHVVKAGPREGGGMKPLSEVYDEIATMMRRANFGDVYNEELQKVRTQFKAGVLSDGIEEYTGVERNAERLMTGVRSETIVPETRARIELARRISSDLNAREYAPECLFWIAYLEITKNGDQRNSKKALDRLDREHPKSDWKKAGDLLRPYTDPNNFTVEKSDLPLALDSPQEFLKKATS